MTREQQRKLRELEKTLPKILKEKIKNYHLKKIDYKVWILKKDMFFDCSICVGVTTDSKCICTIKENIKPLWIDDLLWDFLKMSGNKKEPLSLRAIGAFTVSGVEIYKCGTELKNWEISELEPIINQYLEHFYQSIQTIELDTFYDNISYSPYHEDLRISLTLIYEKKYKEALEYLCDKDKGLFCNSDIWINDAIREFCEKQIE